MGGVLASSCARAPLGKSSFAGNEPGPGRPDPSRDQQVRTRCRCAVAGWRWCSWCRCSERTPSSSRGRGSSRMRCAARRPSCCPVGGVRDDHAVAEQLELRAVGGGRGVRPDLEPGVLARRALAVARREWVRAVLLGRGGGRAPDAESGGRSGDGEAGDDLAGGAGHDVLLDLVAGTCGGALRDDQKVDRPNAHFPGQNPLTSRSFTPHLSGRPPPIGGGRPDKWGVRRAGVSRRCRGGRGRPGRRAGPSSRRGRPDRGS